jgi:hypothetical protein
MRTGRSKFVYDERLVGTNARLDVSDVDIINRYGFLRRLI